MATFLGRATFELCVDDRGERDRGADGAGGRAGAGDGARRSRRCEGGARHRGRPCPGDVPGGPLRLPLHPGGNLTRPTGSAAEADLLHVALEAGVRASSGRSSAGPGRVTRIEPASKTIEGRDGVVDALGLPHDIGIAGTDNDAGVVRVRQVQAPEVTPIVCEHRPTICDAATRIDESSDTPVGQAELRESSPHHAQPTKLLNDPEREVFVCQDTRPSITADSCSSICRSISSRCART